MPSKSTLGTPYLTRSVLEMLAPGCCSGHLAPGCVAYVLAAQDSREDHGEEMPQRRRSAPVHSPVPVFPVRRMFLVVKFIVEVVVVEMVEKRREEQWLL